VTHPETQSVVDNVPWPTHPLYARVLDFLVAINAEIFAKITVRKLWRPVQVQMLSTSPPLRAWHDALPSITRDPLTSVSPEAQRWPAVPITCKWPKPTVLLPMSTALTPVPLEEVSVVAPARLTVITWVLPARPHIQVALPVSALALVSQLLVSLGTQRETAFNVDSITQALPL
jgi:hypothetical protein